MENKPIFDKIDFDDFVSDSNTNFENSKVGIKLLLSMKGISENSENFDGQGDEQDESNFERVEEMTEEEYSKTVKEMDHLLLNIIKTKQKLRLRKLQEKIKTKEDYLNYFGIKDNDDLNIPPEPPKSNGIYASKFKINNQSKSNFDFNSIKEKLKSQQKKLNEKEKDSLKNQKEEFFTTVDAWKINISSNELDLYEEIKNAENKCDDLLDDIDEYIRMGEEFSK